MHRFILNTGFLLLWPFLLYGQSPGTNQQIEQILNEADTALRHNDFEAADLLVQLAFPMARRTNDLVGQARSERIWGFIAEMQEIAETSEKHYLASLALWRIVGDSLKVGSVLRDLSILKESEGDYINQLKYAEGGYRAVAYTTESGKLRGELAIDVANTCFNFGDYQKAIQLYTEALNIHLANGYTIGVAQAQYGLAQLYYHYDSLQKTKEYILPACQSFKSLRDTAGLAQALNILGAIHLDLEQKDSARYYFQESLENAIMAADTALQYDAYLNLTLVEIAEKNVNGAEYYFNKAEALFQSREWVEDGKDLEKTRLILESLLAHNKTKFYSSLLVSLIILLTLLLFGFYLFRKQKQREIRLREEQQRLEQEQDQLLHAQEIDRLLDEVNQQTEIGREEGEREERERLKKLVHNTIGSQLAATKWTLEPYIAASKTKGEGADELENILKMIEQAYTNSRNIERLLERENRNWIQEIEEFFIFLQKSKNSNPKIEFQRHGLDISLPAGMGRWVSQMVKIIVANVLSHAQAKHFNCQLNLLAEELIIIAEDDGKGFHVHSAREDEESSGIRNLEKMVASLHGNLVIDSLSGKGTTTTISLPIAI